MKCEYPNKCPNEAQLKYTYKKISFEEFSAGCDDPDEVLEIDYNKIPDLVDVYYCAHHYRFIEKLFGKDESNV